MVYNATKGVDTMFLCIDLKSFYASVECVIRGLDSMKSNLVVADESRGQGALCLAVSPNLKKLGVKNRCRLFEIPKEIPYIIAKPQMKLYIKYSVLIYKIYLKYVSSTDIYPYSIDEMFLDLTTYHKYYGNNLKNLAETILKDIWQSTGIVATCGIGTNMYLAKVALDILAKHEATNIGFLTEELYLKKLSKHVPLTDFWQIGSGIAKRLAKHHIYTMEDIRQAPPAILIKELGVNAHILINHARGYDDVTFKDIKEYKPKSHSLALSQILFENYSFTDARIILNEMVETLVLDLVKKNLIAGQISLFIGYSNNSYLALNKQKRIFSTSNFKEILNNFYYLYDNYVLPQGLIRHIGISFSQLTDYSYQSYHLFSNIAQERKEHRLFQTINYIKEQYGKNAILRGTNLLPCATQKMRNTLVGGHHE